MIRNEHLDLAVAQGILTADQAERLRTLAKGGDADANNARDHANPDDERFRLIGGFNDVFVTIGIALLVSGLFTLSRAFHFEPGFGVFCVAAAWGLSEFFARKMRLALPSIALALMLALGSAFGGGELGHLISSEFAPIASALAVVLGAVLHERRFGVPVNWAIGAVGLSFALVYTASLMVDHAWYLLFALLGLAIFVVALRIDATDITRETRRSDIAFWLHLVAAPMIVHGTIPLLIGAPEGMNVAQAVAVLGIYAVLGLVAIVIDRRALLVSGLLYAGVALGYLLNENVETSFGSSLTLLALAVIVLGLSAGWRTIRRALIPLLPLGALKQSIPPAH
ncbi:hypothetical protein W911_00835 [Hyphomicrobium nitrativorans NL23]|uniref:DUF2157 domain-containing protein n=1 Tax=Hyphomicrobium nitrativorans NL23 TaxID=1029756 RepID=V5S9Z4_9HYPH|nr:hypothetical protein [Hyphomicrobium nitrativorans]AHB47272.1 hypothetical protein W911_00835 [Hyphomicrobium nitrativorans NL23]